MMEELTKRNGKGMWLREVEKVLKRFDASLEWLLERVDLRERAMSEINRNDQLEGERRPRCSE